MTTDISGQENATRAPTLRPISEVGIGDVLSVGGKGANLGELTRCGLPVPGGFVVTAEAFLAAVDASGCRAELAEKTRRAPSMNTDEIAVFAARSRDLIRDTRLPADVSDDIAAACDNERLARVAVRSSATAEDGATTSFAGMHESFTNVLPA